MGILGDTIMTALRRIPIYRIDCGDTVGLPIPTIVRLSSYHGGRKRTSISFKMMCLSGRKDELLRSSTNRIKPPRTGVLVAPQGFEPRYAAPEAAVLPLNEGAMRHDVPSYSKSRIRCGQCALLFPEHLQGLLAQDAETGCPTSADGQNCRSY